MDGKITQIKFEKLNLYSLLLYCWVKIETVVSIETSEGAVKKILYLNPVWNVKDKL